MVNSRVPYNRAQIFDSKVILLQSGFCARQTFCKRCFLVFKKRVFKCMRVWSEECYTLSDHSHSVLGLCEISISSCVHKQGYCVCIVQLTRHGFCIDGVQVMWNWARSERSSYLCTYRVREWSGQLRAGTPNRTVASRRSASSGTYSVYKHNYAVPAVIIEFKLCFVITARLLRS